MKQVKVSRLENGYVITMSDEAMMPPPFQMSYQEPRTVVAKTIEEVYSFMRDFLVDAVDEVWKK